jgi:hypothetical protein
LLKFVETGQVKGTFNQLNKSGLTQVEGNLSVTLQAAFNCWIEFGYMYGYFSLNLHDNKKKCAAAVGH